MRLEDKVAIVTGAASGIGRATAETFAREGARVVAVDMNGDGAAAVSENLTGDGHLALACDVSDCDRVNEVVAQAIEHAGPITTLFNCAGVDRLPGDGFDEAIARRELPILHMGEDAFLKMLTIHVAGSFYFSKYTIPSMLQVGGGSIINVSSIAGVAGWGGSAYASAKGGVLGLTRSLAREAGAAGIRVNVIAPGVIETPMTDEVPEPMLEPMIALTPLRKMGGADDIANAALYLASDESGFVTGQTLSVNGGLVPS